MHSQLALSYESNRIDLGPHKTTTLKVVDLFSGCGGMTLGFQYAGFDVVGAFDNWTPALEVYRKNFAHAAFFGDLGDSINDDAVCGLAPDVIVGGPPCQDFSSAGPNNHSVARANLLDSFVRIVKASTPKYVVLENVPRLRLRPVFQRAVKSLRSLGYGLTIKILDASLCGVPQQRKRLFLVAALNGSDGFLDSYLDQDLASRPLTLRDYFGESLGTDYYFRVPTNYSRRAVFSIDEPCVTIRAVDRPIPKGYPGHPEDPVPIGPKVRALTVIERAHIQTFPKSFVFEGPKSHLNTMIGNAVPVKLAEYVARALARFIRKSNAVI